MFSFEHMFTCYDVVIGQIFFTLSVNLKAKSFSENLAYTLFS